MTQYREIRADFDRSSIVVYQAYNEAIAEAALRAGRFAAPFSFGRMTWIKPSFLWLMSRSGWASKANQTRILAVRITLDGWAEALSSGGLTSFGADVHRSHSEWEKEFSASDVHIQWDPERSLRGKKLPHRAIQVGLSRNIVDRYVNEWIVGIVDETPRVKKMRALLARGDVSRARRLLPVERPFRAVAPEIALRLGIGIGPRHC